MPRHLIAPCPLGAGASKQNMELTDEEKKVLLVLEQEGPASMDHIARQSNLPIHQVKEIVRRLMVKGLIAERDLSDSG